MRLTWNFLPWVLVVFLLWANWERSADHFPNRPQFLVRCHGPEFVGSFTTEDGVTVEVSDEHDFFDILVAKNPETDELLVYSQGQADIGGTPAPVPRAFVLSEHQETQIKFVAYPPFEGELNYFPLLNRMNASYHHRKDGFGWNVEGPCDDGRVLTGS